MTDNDYLGAIFKATRKAVKKARGEINRLSSVDQAPFPALAASMAKNIEALEKDLEKLKKALKAPAEKKAPSKKKTAKKALAVKKPPEDVSTLA